MNVQDFINNAGQKVVPNPKYNPRSKKNTEPATLIVPDTKPDYDVATNLALQAGLQQWSVDSDVTKKYREYGLNWNPREDMDTQLADAQSNWNKAWHAITQTLVSEIGLGTLRGIADLIDFTVGGAIRTVTGEDNDYTNVVSEAIKGWQDAFNEYQPIYVKPGVDISNGALSDFGWWMSNVPSIASSLTLLIPSTGVTKAVSWAGNATKLTKGVGNARRFLTAINKVDKAAEAGEDLGRLSRFSRWLNNENTVRKANEMVEFGINGFTSRVMENYQEANQVYQDMLPEIYNGDEANGVKGIKNMSDEEYAAFTNRNANALKGVDISDRSAVAKRIAKEAADETFRIDMVNGFFDVYELYGLRNVKRFMNAPMRASVRRAHLNSIRYAGKSADEIKTILAGRSWGKKALEKTGDLLYGSRMAIGAQISEGFEEAVNYIAQEEGMHYGHVLLGSETENSFWDTRIINYAKNPQLYESAFWGVMGGVVFQGAGSRLAEAKNAYNVKSAERKNKPDETTKESTAKTPWSDAFQTEEVRSRIDDINGRAIADNNLRTQLEQIDKGINPFEKNDDGTNKLLQTEEERAIARDKAYNKRERNLLMNSMFVGNWDITRAYLASDEVRDALTQVLIQDAEKRAQEEGRILSNEERNRIRSEQLKRQENVNKTADNMEELYSRNLRAIGNAIRGWNDPETGAKFSSIPTEYFQIIAAENMAHQLDADQFDRNIQEYTPIIGSEEERLKNELSANGIDYKEVIRSFILAQQIGQIDAELEAARKTIKEGRTEDNIDARTISGQSAIRELELRKRTLTGMLRESATSGAWTTNEGAKLLVTLRASAATESDGKGGYKMNVQSERYKKLDAAIVNAFNAQTDEEWKNAFPALLQLAPQFADYSQKQFREAAYAADVFNENVARALGENGAIETLDNLSNKLLSAYANVTYNEIARDIELAHIAKDRQSVRLLAHLKHNDMLSMRGIALESALDSIKGIAKKYSEEVGDISQLLAYGTLDKNARDRLKNILSEEDMRVYDDTMKIIALNKTSVTGAGKNTAAVNTLLPEMIQDAVYQSGRDKFEEIKDEEDATTTTTTGENSSTSQNSTDGLQQSRAANSSQTTPNRATTQQRGQITDFSHNVSGNLLPKPTASIKVNTNGAPIKLNQFGVGHGDYTDVILIPVEGEDGAYELDFKNELDENAKDGTEEVFNNPNFFDVRTPIIDGGTVITNPRVVVNDDGSIAEFRPGAIANPESADGRNEQSEEDRQRRTSQHSSTGGEEQNSGSNELDPSEFDNENNSSSDAETTAAQEIYDPDNLNGDVSRAMMLFAKDRVQAGEEYDENVLYESLREQYKDKVSEEELRAAFNKFRNFGRKIAKKSGLNVKEINDLFDFVDASALTDAAIGGDEASKARRELEKTFTKVLHNYAKRSVTSTYKGKKVISLENLLRYANQIAGDNYMGNLLYDKFVELLREDDNYILLERGELNPSAILERANLSSEERLNLTLSPNGRSIDINSLFRRLSSEQKEKVNEIIDNLHPNDDIEFSLRDNGRGIEFKKNGVVLGTIPVPRNTGSSYVMVNMGWITDIPKSNDGSKSKLEQLFIRIMANPNNEPAITAVIEAIQKAMYTKRKIFDKELEKEVPNPDYEKNLEAIITAIEDGGINLNEYIDLGSKANEASLGAHLVSIYNFVKSASEQWLGKAEMTVEEYNEAIKDRRIEAIHNWFKRLKDSYDTATALAGNPNLKIKVDTVFQGGLIITSKDDPRPVNEKGVIGTNHQGKLNIVVASINEPGLVYSTDGTSTQLKGVNPANTFVAIPRNSGSPALVHAFPQAIGATHFSGVMKEIQKEVLAEFDRLFLEWGNNVTTTSADIVDFINKLCSSKGKNNPLFRGLKVTKLTDRFDGVQIEYSRNGKKEYIKLFDTLNGNYVSGIKFGSEKAQWMSSKSKQGEILSKLRDILKEAITYNIEFDHVRGTRNLKGFAKRGTKGQFVIQIPGGKQHSFKSYKDFIIENGVVAVTTKSSDGKSNFYRPGTSNSQFDRTRVTFKIIDDSSTPVEMRTATQPSAPQSIETKKGDDVKNIIQNNPGSAAVGEQIINKILNNTQLNILKNSRLFRELSVGNIIFVDKIQNAIAAHFGEDKKIGNVTISAGTIAVTQNWIDMLNSDDVADHEEAVRHLIHESIHRKIDTLSGEQQTKLFNSIRSIYNEFVAANEKDGLRDAFKAFEYNSTEKDKKKYYKNGEINERGLEEFLIESITRPHLINRLNGIAANDGKITSRTVGNIKSKNLFQKILATIAKLFNLNINKGSLLEKEYKLFEQVGLTTGEEKDSTDKKRITIRQKSNSAQQLTLPFAENESQNETNQSKDEQTLTQETPQTTVTSTNAITIDSAKDRVSWDDVDESSFTDKEVSSLAQVRDTIITENRETFERLVSKGAIQINC